MTNRQFRRTAAAWLPEVPVDWSMVPAKALFANRNEMSRANDVHLTPSQRFGVVSQEDYMQLSGSRVVLNLSGADRMKHVEEGDFVSHLRSFQGGLERSSLSGKVSAAYTVLAPRESVVGNFFRYLLKCDRYVEALRVTTDQLRDGQSIRYKEFGDVPLPLPSVAAQLAISDFLDRETAQIDAMIDAQRDLVIRLKERRTAMISSHVADDIGARRVQLRRVVRVSDGLVDPTKSPFTDMPLIAPNHIESGTGRLVEAVDSAADQSAISGKGYVRAGQLIYSKIRPALNKLAIAPSDCLCSADMYPLIVNQSMVVTRFLLYAMLDQAFVDQAVMVSERVAMPKVNRETLAGLVIPLPRIERQKDVVAHLDSSTAHIDSTIDAAQASITLMQERRSALISAAVTGRIDPRTGQESTPEMVLEPA